MERHQDGFTTRRALGLRSSAAFVVRKDVFPSAPAKSQAGIWYDVVKSTGALRLEPHRWRRLYHHCRRGSSSHPIRNRMLWIAPLWLCWSMCNNLRPVVRITIRVQPFGCSGFFNRRLLCVMNTGPAIRRFTSQSLWRTSKACESG